MYEKRNPKKNTVFSWIIMGVGALLAIIGAITTQEYKVNLCLMIGLLVIVGGIIYHLVMVRCPYCNHSLAGYKPLPKYCPKCNKKFEEYWT